MQQAYKALLASNSSALTTILMLKVVPVACCLDILVIFYFNSNP